VRCRDFHLTGYEVRQFGAEIVLHLVSSLRSPSPEQSHIVFAAVELYHFVHSGGTIIFGIDELPLSRILDEHWEHILHWATKGSGGVPHWDRDDRASYQAKLEATVTNLGTSVLPSGSRASLSPNRLRTSHMNSPQPPNQSLQLTAGRSDAPHRFMKTCSFQSTLALASGS
jgi:hypothetical protein